VYSVVEDRLELINTLADGNYFRSQHPHGQLCLTAAAWAGSGQVIKLLVSYGGLLTVRNLAGNTLLHSIVLQSSHYPGTCRAAFSLSLHATATILTGQEAVGPYILACGNFLFVGKKIFKFGARNPSYWGNLGSELEF